MTGPPTIQQEHYSDALWGELLPLLERNWRESPSFKKELALDPDPAIYASLDANGLLRCITMRTGAGKLVGYVVYTVYRSPHHKTLLCAHGDVVYVDPDYRGLAAGLWKRAETLLRAQGVNWVGWSANPQSRLYTLLCEMGYKPDEIILEKQLC
jgi:GNAT superfamily N-acetyltransferase